METKICPFCGAPYSNSRRLSPRKWAKRRFCSNSCAAKARIDSLVARNKARRKYPAVEGLSRQQVYYRHKKSYAYAHSQKDKEIRERLVRELGGKCIRCGYDKDIRALVLDHRDGDGKEDRKRLRSKIQRYYIEHLDEAKERLQVLCANCNLIKSIENNEHNKTRRVTFVE